jgi:hypothetical protein
VPPVTVEKYLGPREREKLGKSETEFLMLIANQLRIKAEPRDKGFQWNSWPPGQGEGKTDISPSLRVLEQNQN